MNNYEKIKEILIKNEAYFYLYNWFNKLNKIKYYKCNVIKFFKIVLLSWFILETCPIYRICNKNNENAFYYFY